MKAKKRYVVGFWIATALVVLLAIGMVSVMAAFQATSQGGFNISYTAINVNATITAGWKLTSEASPNYSADFTTIQASDGASGISFADDDSGDTIKSKDFKPTSVTMEKGKELVIKFTIANTALKTDSVDGKFTITQTDEFTAMAKNHNLTVSFYTSKTSTAPTSSSTWEDSLADALTGTLSTGNYLNDGETVYIYVKVSITDPTISVTGMSANAAYFHFALAVV